jgi:hypothetical protein
MRSLLNKRIQAAVMAGVLLLPAATAFGNDWSKHRSRTKGTAVGTVAGAVVGGPVGAVAGGAIGNGVQYLREQNHRHHRVVYHRHYRHRY